MILSGEKEYYYFGDENGVFDCEKKYTIFSFMGRDICRLYTSEIYDLILNWKNYFREHYKSGTLYPLCVNKQY